MTEQNVPAGWYPDPQDGAHRRWWDGTRWTEHTDSAPAPAYGERIPAEYAPKPVEPAEAAPAASWQQPGAGYAQQSTPQQYVPYGAQQQGAYPAAAQYGEHPQAPAGTKANTWAVWILALLPIVTLITLLTVDWRGYLQWALEQSTQQTPSLSTSLPPQNVLTSLGISQAVGFVVWIVGILLAFLDARILKQRGVIRPFGWGWTALSPIVYLIGRGVVLGRRGVSAARGLVPLWAHVAVGLVMFIVLISVISTATSGLLENLPAGSL